MDVASAVSGYVSKMVSVGDNSTGTSSAKMKVLLLDSETVGDSYSTKKTLLNSPRLPYSPPPSLNLPC